MFSPAGIFSALFISLFAIASSVAPAALNKVTMDECFPDENKVYENERLPVTWTARAEAAERQGRHGGVFSRVVDWSIIGQSIKGENHLDDDEGDEFDDDDDDDSSSSLTTISRHRRK